MSLSATSSLLCFTPFLYLKQCTCLIHEPTVLVLILPDNVGVITLVNVPHTCIDYQAPQDMGRGCQMIEETSQHHGTAESDTL